MEQYTVTGMSCAACSARVEKAVSKLEGVTSCSVSLLTNSMGVEGAVSAEAVIAAVEQAGYGASKRVRGSDAGQNAAVASASGAGYTGAAEALVFLSGFSGSADVFFYGAHDVELAGTGVFCRKSCGGRTFAAYPYRDCDGDKSEVFYQRY